MIILLGVAGSGKSVQGKLIAKALRCEYFSTGEFLRQVSDPTIQEKMKAGGLIDDDMVIKVTEEALLKRGTDDDFVLDGFLRTVPQAEWLISAAQKGEFHIVDVLNLQASPEVIVSRLLDRRRPDDQLEIIKKRINEYNQTIKPIVKLLNAAGIEVNEVNADRSVEEVNEEIMKLLEPRLPK